MEAEYSISFRQIFQDILKHKTLYKKVLLVSFLLVAIYAISLPNYYNCTVKLSPELSGSSGSKGGLVGLASSFGINLSSGGAGTEALFPTLYPDLMNSVDFKTSLFKIPVTIEGDKEAGESDRTMTYYDYLSDEQKSPWWSEMMKGTRKWIVSFFKDEKPEIKSLDPFRLTKKQADIVNTIDEKVVCDVDKKTMMITISVTDQNPLICAVMADSVKTRLQNFITDYRTSKARVDLEYNKKVLAEAKARYEKARDAYVHFSDSHREVNTQRGQIKQSDLQNEMQMHQQVCQQVVAQLQQAEMKVQQETPAFTTLQSATVPVLKAGPKRLQICLTFLFMVFMGTTVWILYKENDLSKIVVSLTKKD